MISRGNALVIVDMQRYYLERTSSYFQYFDHNHPGCLDYIVNRCYTITIPNIQKLLKIFRQHELNIIYLKLCSTYPDRRDLHHFFRETYINGQKSGFDNIYPLASDPYSDVVAPIAPQDDDIIIQKTTFSAFNSTTINAQLKEKEITTLIFTGLATSQCVETTARDASDNGFTTIHIEDTQADYDELTHNSSLFSSRGVCGGSIYSTDEYIKIFS